MSFRGKRGICCALVQSRFLGPECGPRNDKHSLIAAHLRSFSNRAQANAVADWPRIGWRWQEIRRITKRTQSCAKRAGRRVCRRKFMNWLYRRPAKLVQKRVSEVTANPPEAAILPRAGWYSPGPRAAAPLFHPQGFGGCWAGLESKRKERGGVAPPAKKGLATALTPARPACPRRRRT